MAGLAIRKLCKSFAGRIVLDHLDLSVDAGQLLVLLGASGSGKTTLLRLIAGLETPDAGEIAIGGRAVGRLSPRQRNVSMVFQDFALYPHMSVGENIAFPLRGRKFSSAQIATKVADVAEKLGLEALLDRRPDQISGGQQQRLAVARALVRDSQLLLMDEPLSNVDVRRRDAMRNELRSLQQEFALTVLYVTHDQTEAMLLGDQIAVIDRGVIQQVAPPDVIYDQPANRFVAQFVGSPPMNFIPDGRVGLLGIRPEDLSFRSAGDDDLEIAGVVDAVQCLGSHNVVHLRSAGGRIAVIVDRQQQLEVGQQLTACVARCRLHRFATSDGARLTSPMG
ncbi:sn-glycerol-3-phosphate import ATP-binding protein UgpC [Rosistilla ulvae]|uniref:sn-glycerol-3-phosphate import ATP-binding protein UgpC n=1 Tax=Rosistilla ulvae TaxID=1930277 RepID=A0A517M6X2_9BACT|nr:ABC transporter ATP-binding protein [Rosistilla ulvae]QDS90630.1 sn-glycerol-3-phosphate import ATP-binding protein UgpC [Rosistilla ulvae]